MAYTEIEISDSIFVIDNSSIHRHKGLIKNIIEKCYLFIYLTFSRTLYNEIVLD